MIKWVTSLILLIGLIMVACASGNQGDLPLTPDRSPPSPVTDDVGPPALTSIPEPTSSIRDDPQVGIKTDKDLYRQGESLLISIENNSSSPIQFVEFCSLHLCIQAGGDWICAEHECDGPMIRLERGSQLEFLEEARSINPENKSELISRYKLDYQIVSKDPYYFAYSNEFSVQKNGPTCERAKQFALDYAQSSPYWKDIDIGRTHVSWGGDDQTCIVDFAWRSAEQIRPGLWTEGYIVRVDLKSDQVLEAYAYER